MIEFTLPVKPFSVNKMHYRDQRFKSAEYKDWAQLVLYHLQDIKALHEMGMDWHSKGGSFCVWFTFEFPKHIFYNKAGAISSKSMDLSNVEKPLLDLIFGDTMDVNDKNVVKLVSRKEAGAFYCIRIRILHLLPEHQS